MTIPQLAEEYSRSAELVRRRIAELERAVEETEDEELRFRLDSRIRPLRTIYRQTRETARYLGSYYHRRRNYGIQQDLL